MNKPSFDLLSSYRTNQGLSLLFGHVMVSLMMVTIAVGFAQLGSRLFPDWNGLYIVIVALIVAVEAIATRKQLEDMDLRDRVIFHISEWIAFAVALKIIVYIVRGPAQLLRDIPLWQANFLENFFTGEYAFALFVTLLIWLFTIGYAGDMKELYLREEDAVWDDLGKLQNALHDIRNRISGRIFILGGLVVLLAIFSRISMSFALREGSQAGFGPIINVLLYFTMALVLLSQTQFALLRTRWLWQRLPISPGLAKNWVKYGILFFVVLGIIVFFLPTSYTVGLLDTLRYSFGFLSQVFSVVLFLFTLPLTLCISLLSLLMGKGTSTLPPQSPNTMMPPAAHAQPIPWVEILRSLLFWMIFLGVIFFAVRFYLSQNTALWNAIISFPFFRWLSGAWKGFWRWVKGANRQMRTLVSAGIKRLRQQRAVISAQAVRRIFNLAQMSPREKIIFFYLSLVQLGGERGLERRPAQTPYQYEERLSRTLPEVDQDLRVLTDTFIEARYSQHMVDQPKSEQANSLWERIKAALLSWKRTE